MILKTLKLLNSDENGGKAIFRVFRVLTWTNSEIQGFQGHILSFQGFQGPVDTLVYGGMCVCVCVYGGTCVCIYMCVYENNSF